MDELEAQLAGMALSAWSEVEAHFAPELFRDENLQAIAVAIQDEARRRPGKSPSPARVTIALPKERSALLKDLMAAYDPMLHDATAVAQELARRQRARRLNELLVKTHKALKEPAADVSHIAAGLQSEIIDVLFAADAVEVQEMSAVLNDLHIEIEDARSGKAAAVLPVGLMDVTRLIKGLKRKESTVVAGRPGMGKSAFVGHVATWLAKRRGVRSLIVSLEMPSTGWVGRTVARDARIDSKQWRDPTNWTQAMYNAAQTGMSALMDLPIGFIDKRGLDVDQICAQARLYKAQHPDLAVLAVDHLGLVEPGSGTRKSESTAKIVGNNAKQLRNLAAELDVALILLAQINRGVEQRDDKVPRLSDLRDSGEVEEHADLVLGLYRESYYDKERDDPRTRNVCEVHALKGRPVGDGDVALIRFDGPLIAFGDLSESEKRAYIEATSRG